MTAPALTHSPQTFLREGLGVTGPLAAFTVLNGLGAWLLAGPNAFNVTALSVGTAALPHFVYHARYLAPLTPAPARLTAASNVALGNTVLGATHTALLAQEAWKLNQLRIKHGNNNAGDIATCLTVAAGLGAAVCAQVTRKAWQQSRQICRLKAGG